MQYKILILALLLIAASAQGGTPVETTVDDATSADATDKPTSAPPRQAPALRTTMQKSSAQSPPGETKTINSAIAIPNRNVIYTINVWTSCPNTVWLWIRASSWFRISYGSFTSGWYAPWQWHFIPITPNCQCTTIQVQVFNWWGVPTWISYGTWQDTTNCYNCKNDPLKFFNHQNCRCECKRNCCFPSWYFVNKDTCQCQRGFIGIDPVSDIRFAMVEKAQISTP